MNQRQIFKQGNETFCSLADRLTVSEEELCSVKLVNKGGHKQDNLSFQKPGFPNDSTWLLEGRSEWQACVY
jgi:hypothetical protein